MVFEQADFTNEESTLKMIKRITEKYGEISHVVHLSSVRVENIKFKNTNWDSYNTAYNIQVRSIYIILKELLPYMEKDKYGKIVLMLSSCTINEPPKYWSDYVTNKYALLGFMKALAAEYVHKKININAISPSMIETQFLQNIPDIMIEKNATLSPLKRNAQVQDIVPLIKFLLSDEASYITGQNIAITGGNR